MQIKLSNAAILGAASLFQAKGDVRYYLNGLCFSVSADNTPVITATDGCRLIQFEDCRGSIDLVWEKELLLDIPGDLLKKLRQKAALDSPITITGERKELRFEYDNTVYMGEAIDGTYPNVQNVMKTAEDYLAPESVGEISWFDPAYLGDYAKVAKILGVESAGIRIASTGKMGGAVIEMLGINYCKSVLMPIKGN